MWDLGLDSITLLILTVPVLLGCMLIYLVLARRWNIVDIPNQRSSHHSVIIRGGGLIFYLGFMWFQLVQGIPNLYLTIGATLIAAISFLDDIKSQSRLVRLSIHLIAVFFLGLELNLFGHPVHILILIALTVLGALNAYNFMDGINGITVVYSVVTISTLWLINHYFHTFESGTLMLITLISLIIFGYFNVRKKAVCFAGDVGSIFIAFLLGYLILKLISSSDDLSFILLLSVYGVETVLTIIERLAQKKNIFEAHREHLYQYLTNGLGYRHVQVSIGYGLIQALINVIVIINNLNWHFNFWYMAGMVLLPVGLIYILVKLIVLRKIQAA